MRAIPAHPLAKKLGLKPGFAIKLVNPPGHYFDLFPDLPADLDRPDDPGTAKDFIHFFTKNPPELEQGLKELKKSSGQTG